MSFSIKFLIFTTTINLFLFIQLSLSDDNDLANNCPIKKIGQPWPGKQGDACDNYSVVCCSGLVCEHTVKNQGGTWLPNGWLCEPGNSCIQKDKACKKGTDGCCYPYECGKFNGNDGKCINVPN